MNGFLLVSAWIAIVVGTCGFVVGFWSFFAAKASRPIPASADLRRNPAPPPVWTSTAAVLFRPWNKFQLRSNPIWYVGCACYHAAISIVVTTYAASLASLALRPSARPLDGEFAGWAFSVATCGNVDVSIRLFGAFAPAARVLTFLELPLALAGNALLLLAFARGHHGRVAGHRLAPGGIRSIEGTRKPGHLVVRLTITSIVASEFLGRMGIAWAVPAHVALALWLFAIAPFTHLRHVPWIPVALVLAWKRRRNLSIA